jgi:hypothetical protein
VTEAFFELVRRIKACKSVGAEEGKKCILQ